VTRLTVVPLRSSLIQGNDKNLGPLSAPSWHSAMLSVVSRPCLLKRAHSQGYVRTTMVKRRSRLENQAFVGKAQWGRRFQTKC
jgi:hypothetical protein